jgi:hypothetical protein
MKLSACHDKRNIKILILKEQFSYESMQKILPIDNLFLHVYFKNYFSEWSLGKGEIPTPEFFIYIEHPKRPIARADWGDCKSTFIP